MWMWMKMVIKMKLKILNWLKIPPDYQDHRFTLELDLTSREFKGLTKNYSTFEETIRKLLKFYIDAKLICPKCEKPLFFGKKPFEFVCKNESCRASL